MPVSQAHIASLESDNARLASIVAETQEALAAARREACDARQDAITIRVRRAGVVSTCCVLVTIRRRKRGPVARPLFARLLHDLWRLAPRVPPVRLCSHLM